MGRPSFSRRRGAGNLSRSEYGEDGENSGGNGDCRGLRAYRKFAAPLKYLFSTSTAPLQYLSGPPSSYAVREALPSPASRGVSECAPQP